ncbi:PLP-dependent aminotransferase family protein [Hwanghaeella grinnelliae]|uniref:PLP-dependent aminotransferase family protein n=1 Tax=Hwanghaeella grinnelliae TaxID=2500179 RepID=A0A437QN49_9PROT|nr:PLP-dependent aminotransferase family protein [Hwanghaeella grinnelliae]RVU35942.1 PLP-dependent aminotransferase family protein [Hwanghaeella grinnelliae]
MTKLADWFETSNDATKVLLRLGARPDVISLAGGLPAPELFPGDAVADAFAHVARSAPAVSLQYGPAEGIEPLRALIAAQMRKEGAGSVTAENVLITTGSQQGLTLIGQTLLNKGDRIALDEPTFLGALDAWRPREPGYTAIDWSGNTPVFKPSSDAETMPKFAYCLPNFRNPTGETMTLDARKALVAAAQRDDVILIEDNPYGALRYEGVQPASLISIADQGGDGPYDGHVIYTGTVSKTLAPALRVGWMVVPQRLLHGLIISKQGLDLCTSPLTQYAALHLIETGVEAETSERARDLYRIRRDAMLAALEAEMPAGVTWTRPEGGMFVWVTLPEGTDAHDIFQRAADARVAIVPGDVFYAMNPAHNTMRLNFTNVPEATIAEAVQRLAGVIEGRARNAA